MNHDLALRRDPMHFGLVEGTHRVRGRAYEASADGFGFPRPSGTRSATTAMGPFAGVTAPTRILGPKVTRAAAGEVRRRGRIP